jgi:SAM-dependent methyltransferase
MSEQTLYQLYAEHTGKVSDKWSIYLSEYDRVFSSYRDKSISLLEIGIQNGGSLEVWSKYFYDVKKIVGCDINPDCAQLQYEDPRISVVVGDANTLETRNKILKLNQAFDIIIDDGSHQSSDIIRSFSTYFPALADHGIFVVEDLHCSYWTEFEGGLFETFSSINFFKRLADIINYEHWGLNISRESLLQGFFDKYQVQIEDALLQQIHSIEFINSICLIRKKPAVNNILGTRFIAGQYAQAVQEPSALHGTIANPPSQHYESFTGQIISLDEEHALLVKKTDELNHELASCNYELANIRLELASRNHQLTNLELEISDKEKAFFGEVSNLKQIIIERELAIINIYRSLSWRITMPLRLLKRNIQTLYKHSK